MTFARLAGSALGLVVLLALAPVAPVRAVAASGTNAQLGPADIDRLLDSADALMARRDLDKAQTEVDQALEVAKASAFEPQIARALLSQSDLLLRRNQPAAAMPVAEEALASFQRLGHRPGVARTSFLLSRIANANHNQPAAIAHAERALEEFQATNDAAGIAHAVLQIFRVSDPDLEQLRDLARRGATAAHAAGDADAEGEILHSAGDQLFNRGSYEDAMQMLTGAAAAYESGQLMIDVGTVYNSIGRVYRAHGRLDEALKFQKAALELHRKGNNPTMLLQSLNAVGVVYQRMEDSASAQAYLQEALTVAEKVGSPRVQDFLRANRADMLIDIGMFGPAAETLEQVIAHGLDSFPATRKVQLATAYIGLGRGREALATVDAALAGCANEEQDVCLHAYITRSSALALLGRSEEALADLSLALRRLEEVRGQLVPADFFRQNFHRYYQSVYTNTIAMQVAAGHQQQSLESAELGRARAFLDLLASRALPPAPDRTIVTPPLQLRGGGGASTSSPEATTQALPATKADLVATATRLGSTLLLYWVAPDETFIWVVKPDGSMHTRRVPVRRSKLNALVRETSPFVDGNNLSAPSLRDASPAWRELYSYLIAPVVDVLPKSPGALLTVVPHESLMRLSFAALQNSRGRYLLEDYTLHYAPAGAMFRFTEPQQPASKSGSMMLVSDPVPPKLSALDPPLPRLPGSRSEAAAIARMMPAGLIKSLQDATATESNVRGAAPNNRILHFATHAVVRDDDPFGSYLALGSSTGTGAADGLLTAQEIYGLRLNADLVVLSSCRSAGGIVTGDGIATFARAFLYTGTSSFVASVWDVADEPTNGLLQDFYRAWFGGASKAVALRRAQLKLLADLRAGRVRVKMPVGEATLPAHPVFWAGFELFGEAR